MTHGPSKQRSRRPSSSRTKVASAAQPLKFASAEISLSVSSDAAARARRDGWTVLDRGEIARPSPASSEVGTIDANGYLVVPGRRVVTRREKDGYRPAFLVRADRAGDPAALEALDGADEQALLQTRRPAAADVLRPTRAAVRLLRTLLLVHVVLAALLVGLAFVGVDSGGESASIEGLMTFGLLGLAQSGLVLVTGIVWLVWQYRVHCNVLRLGIPGVRRSPARGVVWWIVPLVNAVLPYLVIRRLWKALTAAAAAEGRGTSLPRPAIGVWWMAWLAATNLAVLAIAVQTTGELLLLGAVSNAAYVIAALLAQGVVRAIQRQHDFVSGLGT